MPVIPLDPDAPWWVNAILGYGLLLLGFWVLTRQLRREVRETKGVAVRAEGHASAAAESAGIAAAETTRNHGSSMKDAIDRLERRDRDRGEALGRIEASVTTLTRDVGGLRSDMRQEREERRDVSRRLDEHIQDVPRLTAEATVAAEAAHVGRCPLRRDDT